MVGITLLWYLNNFNVNQVCMNPELTLKIDYNINYLLIAVRGRIEDYQFAYFLNKSPFFLFRRMEKDVSYLINKKKIYFSAFEHINTELKRNSFLIKNKAVYNSELNTKGNLFLGDTISNTVFLIPELKEFDYFIKLIGIWEEKEFLVLKKFLYNMKNIESETNINLKQIKSINNLVF